MATTEEIKKTAILVRDATQIGENTAERVGGVLVDLANKSKELEDNIGKKADKETVNAALDKKADKETVDAELGKKANTADVDTKFTSEAARVNAELDKKANAEEVKQSFSEQTAKNTAQDAEIAKKANAEDVNNSMQELNKKLNRNLLAIEFDDETGDLNAIIGQDSTISSVSTDEDGNVIIEQNII